MSVDVGASDARSISSSDDWKNIPGYNDMSKADKAKADFQQTLQKQTEAFTFITTILKMLHDKFQAWCQNLK